MSFLLANWRLLFFIALAVGVAWVGAHIKGRFDRANDADRLETERDMAVQNAELAAIAYKKADADRVLMSAQIADYQEQLRVDVGVVIKKIPVYIKDDRQCDVPVEVLKDLNRAMGQPE